MKKKLYVTDIDNPHVQENFKVIGEEFKTIPFLKGEWRFVEITIPATVSNQTFAHNLQFTPKDVILTSSIGGSIVFNYSSFNSNFINFTATVTTTPMVVRAFIGRYTEDSIYV